MYLLAVFVADDLLLFGLGASLLFGFGSTIYGQITQRKAENHQAQYQQEALKAQGEANKLQQEAVTQANKAIEDQNVSKALAASMAKKDKDSEEVAATRKITRNATKIDPNSGISEQDSTNDMYGMGLRIPTK